MRLERQRADVAVSLQRTELPDVIDHAFPHRRPFRLAVAEIDDVLQVHVRDAIFRDFGVAVGEGVLAARPRVARIPVEHQRLLADRAEQPRGFGAGRRVARQLVLERERDGLLPDLDRCLAHAIVDRFSVRRLVVEAPEIEDSDVSRVESLGEVHGAFDQLVLLPVGEVGAELRVLGAERRFRRAGPVGLEDCRCDLRDAQVVLRENGFGFGDVMRVPAHDVLVVHRTKLDQPEAELARHHLAGAAEVLRDLIGQHRKLE